MRSHEELLRAMIMADAQRLHALVVLRELQIPQGAIGAGYIRTAVWDALCGMRPSPVEDVDVLYYDPGNLSWEAETAIESRLQAVLPGLPWSVRNQARMHLRNGDPPYQSVEHAMRYWLETPTCIALYLEFSERLSIIAPFGLDDLFGLRIRPTPQGECHPERYRARVTAKRWHERWPGVTLELPEVR
jgi:uncharacterized protein